MDVLERIVRYYVTASGACPFAKWRDRISDKRAKAAIDARVARLRSGNVGDSKPIGGGATESRIDCGPGYRIYYGVDGYDLILLLGGTKSSQPADIKNAKSFWKATRSGNPVRAKRDYKADLLRDLRSDPEYAAQYLSAAKKDSKEAFLIALRDVAEARLGLSQIARVAHVNRESLYRTLSAEGNPTLATLDAVLGVLGFETDFRPIAARRSRGSALPARKRVPRRTGS
jgi:putative addiction module killer protein/probable addiction module antidote protein